MFYDMNIVAKISNWLQSRFPNLTRSPIWQSLCFKKSDERAYLLLKILWFLIANWTSKLVSPLASMLDSALKTAPCFCHPVCAWFSCKNCPAWLFQHIYAWFSFKNSPPAFASMSILDSKCRLYKQKFCAMSHEQNTDRYQYTWCDTIDEIDYHLL